MDSAKFVGSIPENCDQYLGPHIFEGYADDLARRISILNPGSVLELASGTGILTRKIGSLLDRACDLIASDLNEPMLEVARAKFDDGDEVKFEVADAMELPYANERFDVVTCQFGVMFFPDKTRSYQEAHRVLKYGGAYVFSVWGPWATNPFARIAHETVASFFPDNPPGFYKVPFGYHDGDEIRRVLESAGFSPVSTEEVNLTSKIMSPDEFARGLVFGNPLYQEVTDRGGDVNEVCDAVSASIEQELGSEMPLQAVVVTAYKN